MRATGSKAPTIAVTSYEGQLNFGVLGDYETMPDVDVVSQAISAGLAELVSKCNVGFLPGARRPARAPRAERETAAFAVGA